VSFRYGLLCCCFNQLLSRWLMVIPFTAWIRHQCNQLHAAVWLRPPNRQQAADVAPVHPASLHQVLTMTTTWNRFCSLRSLQKLVKRSIHPLSPLTTKPYHQLLISYINSANFSLYLLTYGLLVAVSNCAFIESSNTCCHLLWLLVLDWCFFINVIN